MREIVLDTETTGLDPAEGHRVVEIGAVELHRHVPTGVTFHRYLNPERAMPPEAFAVHGLNDAFLADKPKFKEVAAEFLAFIGDDKLIIHNAAFDLKFLNAELARIGLQRITSDRAIDTAAVARGKFPGAPASLDALCRRYNVDNSGREKHGALLDSELLAEVYLELIGGRQPDFGLTTVEGARAAAAPAYAPPPRPRPLAPRVTEAEAAAHAAFVASLGEGNFWAKIG